MGSRKCAAALASVGQHDPMPKFNANSPPPFRASSLSTQPTQLLPVEQTPSGALDGPGNPQDRICHHEVLAGLPQRRKRPALEEGGSAEALDDMLADQLWRDEPPFDALPGAPPFKRTRMEILAHSGGNVGATTSGLPKATNATDAWSPQGLASLVEQIDTGTPQEIGRPMRSVSISGPSLSEPPGASTTGAPHQAKSTNTADLLRAFQTSFDPAAIPRAGKQSATWAALHELLTRTAAHLQKKPGVKPFDAGTIRECAITHGLDPKLFCKTISQWGHPTPDGFAELQLWENKAKGLSHEKITASFLLRLEARIRCGDLKLESTRSWIVDVALLHGVSISRLLQLLKTNGSRTKKGQALVDASGRGDRGTPTASQPKYAHFTPDLLRKIGDCIRRERCPLPASAERFNVSVSAVSQYMHADGVLSPRGENFLYVDDEKLAGRVPRKVTVGELIKLLAFFRKSSCVSDAMLFAYAKDRNLAFKGFKAYLCLDKTFTIAGKALLRRHGFDETTIRSLTMSAPDGNTPPPDPPGPSTTS